MKEKKSVNKIQETWSRPKTQTVSRAVMSQATLEKLIERMDQKKHQMSLKKSMTK